LLESNNRYKGLLTLALLHHFALNTVTEEMRMVVTSEERRDNWEKKAVEK